MLDETTLWLKGEGGWIELYIMGVNKDDRWTASYRLFEMEAPQRTHDEWWVCWDQPLYHLPDECIPADSMTEEQLREFIVTKYILLRGEGEANNVRG